MYDVGTAALYAGTVLKLLLTPAKVLGGTVMVGLCPEAGDGSFGVTPRLVAAAPAEV